MPPLPNCYFEIRELIEQCPNNEVWGDLLRGAVKAYDAWDYQRLGQIAKDALAIGPCEAWYSPRLHPIVIRVFVRG